MPTIVDVIGSYRLAARSGACTGIAAAGAIFAFRWAHATAKARILSIEVSHLVTTGYTAAQEVGYDVVIGRSWSAAPTGGTGLTLTTNNGKLRQDYDTTRLTAGDVRISTTAALANGTVTLDAHPLAVDSVWSLAATAGAGIAWNRAPLHLAEAGGLILEQNEGFLVRNLVAQGAAGVGGWFVAVQWDEILVA